MVLKKQNTTLIMRGLSREQVDEQWEQLHCRHAEMHFSFMHPA